MHQIINGENIFMFAPFKSIYPFERKNTLMQIEIFNGVHIKKL